MTAQSPSARRMRLADVDGRPDPSGHGPIDPVTVTYRNCSAEMAFAGRVQADGQWRLVDELNPASLI